MTQMLEIPTDMAQPANSIRIDVGTLRRAISRVAQVVERQNTIPVLSCLLLETDGTRLRITGTDLDMAMSTSITLSAPAPSARMVIPASTLSGILRGAEKGDLVDITAEAAQDRGSRVIRVSVGPLSVRIHEICQADDFPLLNRAPATEPVTIPVAMLRAILDSCSPCISGEETRYYLNGIYLHGIEGMLCGVATDGHRMARYLTEQPWPLPSVIVHKKTVKILRQMLMGDGEITVTGHEMPRLIIEGEGWTLVAKTIDGTFPDYARTIPIHDKAGGTACLNAALFRRLPLGSFSSRAAALDLKDKTISVTVPGEFDALMPIEATGEIRIGFNVNYLASMVAAWGTIRLSCGSARDAALIHSEDPNLLGVLMPRRIE